MNRKRDVEFMMKIDTILQLHLAIEHKIGIVLWEDQSIQFYRNDLTGYLSNVIFLFSENLSV